MNYTTYVKKYFINWLKSKKLLAKYIELATDSHDMDEFFNSTHPILYINNAFNFQVSDEICWSTIANDWENEYMELHKSKHEYSNMMN